jgi:hypothetical protein
MQSFGMERFHLENDIEVEEPQQFQISNRSTVYEIWILKFTCDIVKIRHFEDTKTTLRGINRLLRLKAV